MAEGFFGLVGRRLSHSFSPAIYGALGLPGYRLIEVEPEGVAHFIGAGGFGGLNVTLPYKQTVIPFCATLSEEARATGSVNVLIPGPGGLAGHNTDAHGLRYMARQAGISFAGARVLVFGSGGAARTARYVAQSGGAASAVTISRTGPDHYGNLHLHREADILINATPVGMYPENGRAVAGLSAFPRCRGVLDMVYNPLRTPLVLEARAAGIPHAGGLPMLVAQAAAALTLFTGRQVGEDEVGAVLSGLSRDTESIVLIGMPGSGKSAVGAALARLAGRELVDLDAQVAKAARMPIPTIFDIKGEGAFRQLERQAAQDAGRRWGLVLATGGGIVKDPGNYPALAQNGRIYHLTRPAKLLERGGRPLSVKADLLAMQQERLPLYRAFRDTEIANIGTVDQAAAAIWRDFHAHCRD